MADAGANKSSFLGSMSPWLRSSTPPPKSPRQPSKSEDGLRQSSGNDHSVSLRPTPSLRRYPKDCPPLKTRWYYAVDVAKRKPFASQQSTADKPKQQPAPRKWVSFSVSDSRAIENAFQALDKDDGANDQTSLEPTSTKVPVNEDYLFDVHVEKRELEPAYWLGPVYEVRRGSWFSSDGQPCDENLARQLEEGYLRVSPWKKGPVHSRSSSQSRPSAMVIEGALNQKPGDAHVAETPISNTTRLFGIYMNTIVTYQDANVAYLSSDDLMSRIGSTVYTRLGGQSGTKVVRGYTDIGKVAVVKPADAKDKKPTGKQAAAAPSLGRGATNKANEQPESPLPPRPSLIERQLSSLAGLRESRDEERMAEEDDQKVQEQEMEDAREKDGDDQARQIDHLVLVTHGIGQRLGLRLDSINFVHDVSMLRKTMKAVYETSPDLQALSDNPKNCRVQVLPICWRHLLDFPKQSLKQNRKEFDLGDMDSVTDDEYPSLQDITVEGVPTVRNLITDLAMDVLLYQSAYREHIASIVQREANRIYQLFKKRTGFKGKVSLCGHSLGSAVLFDILCRQGDNTVNRPRRVSSRTSRDVYHENTDVKLDFECNNFFALGSPIALFQMLKGRTIAARSTLHDRAPAVSPFDMESMIKDPFTAGPKAPLIPITVSSPKCSQLFNIFHPTDPIAYRIEPLISPAMAQLSPQTLPYVKKGLFNTPGIANISARVGQQVMSSWYSLTSGVASSLINRSLGITGDEQALPQDRGKQNSISSQTHAGSAPIITKTSMDNSEVPNNLAHLDKKQQDLADLAHRQGRTETLIDAEIETLYSGFQKRNRSRSNSTHSETPSTGDPPTLDLDDLDAKEQTRRIKREEAKVRALNNNGRVDYHIQEGMFDVSLLASIASHLSYWADEDVNHFLLGEMLKQSKTGGERRGGVKDNDVDEADFGDMSSIGAKMQL